MKTITDHDTNFLKNRSWFDLGGRHGLENRVSDLAKILSGLDLAEMCVADIGAAEGDVAIWLAKIFKHVTAIELMEKAYLSLTKKTHRHDNINVVQSDILSYDFDQSFDVTFLLGVLHYFLDDNDKHTIVDKILKNSRWCCFIRTGIRENKIKHNMAHQKLQKFTPVDVYVHASKKAGFSLAIIDNFDRGQDTNRLGDLAVFRSNHKKNPLPELRQMVSQIEEPIYYY
jgi:2-polyprenyl-3-methyl-5-hydroxy-6-metoxy-1,4-benzoquinol methylase